MKRICIYFSRKFIRSIYDLLMFDIDGWTVDGVDFLHKSGIEISDFLFLKITKPARVDMNFFETVLIRNGLEFLKEEKTKRAIEDWGKKLDSKLEL